MFLSSAGIGRTGTFIAIDALYEEGQQTGKVYIADYVTKMREKRMNMVQTYVNNYMQDILIQHLTQSFTHLKESFRNNNIETHNVLFDTRNL